MGARLGYQKKLCYVDPLLKIVPENRRDIFYYFGEGAKYPTKYGCEAVIDHKNAVIGPWFQPAMSVSMALPVSIGGAECSLYITPLFTLFTAIALAALASLLITHRFAAIIAAVTFLSCPVILWHGRCPRPEMTASFLLFSGAAILLHAWRSRKWNSFPDILIGAFCISLAPLFHVIAWGPVLVAAVVVAMIIICGRTDFILYPIIAVCTFVLFIFQITTVIDTYNLSRFIEAVIDAPILSTIIFSVGMMVMTLVSLYVAKHEFCVTKVSVGWAKHIPGSLLAIVVFMTVLVVYIYSSSHAPDKANMFYHFLYPTDLPTVIRMVSWPIAILSMVGLIVLALRYPVGRHKELVAILLFVAPSSLLIGHFYDFFMVRYTIVSLLPIMAIGLASIITIVPANSKRQQIVLVLSVVIMLSLGLHNRLHLATSIQYKGFVEFIGDTAEKIKEENGILLCEYSRIAAPFDHFYGIPTLGLNNERCQDYTDAELSWVKILNTITNRPAFFITPYDRPPLSQHLSFEFVKSSKYKGERLREQRWALPQGVSSWGCKLNLYRMTLAESKKAIPDKVKSPLAFGFDAGNMGLNDFANCRDFDITVSTVFVTTGKSKSLSIPAGTKDNSEIFLFCYKKDSEQFSLKLSLDGEPLAVQSQNVAPGWMLCRSLINDISNHDRTLMLSTDADAFFLESAHLVSGSKVANLFAGWQETDSMKEVSFTVKTRWARKGARLALPNMPSSYLCILLVGPEEIAEDNINMKVGVDSKIYTEQKIPTGEWIWTVWPVIPADNSKSFCSLKIETDTKFDPKHKSYPDDLAVLLGYATVLNVTQSSTKATR